MITESDLQSKTKEEVAEIILAMQRVICEKDAIIAENKITIADKNKIIEYLYEQFRLSRYKRFGSQSEKDTDGPRQLSLFDEATAPARETVQVAGLPKGVNIEISMIAVAS